MNSGYINEGGQLKAKNGQKYVINSRRKGVYVPRYCIIVTALLGIIAMIVISLLSYFLLSQTSTSGHEYHPADHDRGNTTAQFALAGSFGGDHGDRQPKLLTNTISDTLTADTVDIGALTSTSTEAQLNDYGDDDTGNTGAAALIVESEEGWSPVLYRLLIEPDFDASISSGSVAIEVTEDAPITMDGALPLPIVLNINRIQITGARVTLNDSIALRSLVIDDGYGPQNETYVLRILEPLPPTTGSAQQTITVHLDFISQLSDTLTGFYVTAYRANGVEHLMASTQFSPVDARRAFPCFDRPDKKARFEISVVRHKNYTMALSNMPSIRSSIPRPGYIREDFNVTPRMSTYLVAFVVSNLVNTTVDETIDAPHLPKIRMWTRPQHQHQTQFVYTMTTRMLSFLDRYFGIPFGLPKIDLVAVPEFGFSAMENWGLITFRESGLLVPAAEENRSILQTKSVCMTLGHEIAHQWFGNLVTMRDWNDLWLKEGFATYLSYVTLETVEPLWHAMDFFSHGELQRAMSVDSDDSAHPISFPVNSTADIRRMFDPISYSKGAAIVGMLNGIFGDHTFKTALRVFLEQYSYGNAEQDDLWRIMTEQSHITGALAADMNVKTIMDTWTLQAGYPVLQVTRDSVAGTVRFTQQRYVRPNATIRSTNNAPQRWYIPITFETAQQRSRSTRPMHWLRPDAPDGTLTLHNVTTNAMDWLYANIRRVGYYRVNYDRDSWLTLSRNFFDLPPVEQGALVDDALALAQAALLQYDVPLTLLMKVARSGDVGDLGALPWAAAEPGVQFLSQMLSREPANADWRALMRYVLHPMFNQIGFQEVLDDTPVRKEHRVRVIEAACFFGVERCVNRATQLFRTWMANADTVRLSPDLQSTILCTALRHGNPNSGDWQFVYERYLNQSTASEKIVYLKALGCTEKPWLLSRYLNMTLSGAAGIRKQDGSFAFAAVAHNAIGNELAFEFLSTNIAQFSKYYGDGFSTIRKMIISTTAFANLPLQLTKYEAFAENARKLGLHSIETSIRLLLPGVRNNVYWRNHQYYELEKFLRDLVSMKKLND